MIIHYSVVIYLGVIIIFNTLFIIYIQYDHIFHMIISLLLFVSLLAKQILCKNNFSSGSKVGRWAHTKPRPTMTAMTLFPRGTHFLDCLFYFPFLYVGQTDVAHSGIYYWWCVSLDCIQFKDVANSVIVFLSENQVTGSGSIVCKYIHKDWDDSWFWKMPCKYITEIRY